MNLGEKHLKLTETITSVFLFSTEIFHLVFPFIIGPYIEERPNLLTFAEFILLISNIFIIISIILLIKLKKNSK